MNEKEQRNARQDLFGPDYYELACQILGKGCLDEYPMPELNFDGSPDPSYNPNPGDLSDEEDGNLRLKLGIPYSEWRNMPEGQRISCMKVALKSGSSDPPVQHAERDSLSDDEYTVLSQLRSARPRRVFMVDLATDTSIARKGCSNICRELTKRGLVEYDEKARRGATITKKGEMLLDEERNP